MLQGVLASVHTNLLLCNVARCFHTYLCRWPPQVLSGNNDSSTPVTNTLGLPFLARQVYIYPSLWVGPAPSLRWELLGCLEGKINILLNLYFAR